MLNRITSLNVLSLYLVKGLKQKNSLWTFKTQFANADPDEKVF